MLTSASVGRLVVIRFLERLGRLDRTDDWSTEAVLIEWDWDSAIAALGASPQLRLFDDADLVTEVPNPLLPELSRISDSKLSRQPTDLGAVLAFVNTVRDAQGLDGLGALPVRGAVPADPERCLLARAMDCTVTDEACILASTTAADRVRAATGERGEAEIVSLPADAIVLAAKFDRGLVSAADLSPPDPAQLKASAWRDRGTYGRCDRRLAGVCGGASSVDRSIECSNDLGTAASETKLLHRLL